MLALLLAVAAPDLPSIYKALQAEVRPIAPPSIDEVLEEIRKAPNASEEAKLLEKLVTRCGGLDTQEQKKVIDFLSPRAGKSRSTLGQCAVWFSDNWMYEQAVRALLDVSDTYALRGLVDASKRLDRSGMTLAEDVMDKGLDVLRDSTLYQDRVYSALILYNALSSGRFVKLDSDFESVVLIPMENTHTWVQSFGNGDDYRWAMMRLLRRGAWRFMDQDADRLRHRSREVFRQLGELDPNAQLRQQARQWAQNSYL